MNKSLDKKAILFAAVLILTVQLISILAQQASFSLAQGASLTGTATPVEMAIYANNAPLNSGMALNGAEIFKAAVNPSMVMLTNGPSAPLSAVGFYLDNPSTSGIDAGLTGSNSGTEWTADLSIYSSLADGNYDFYAKAFYGSAGSGGYPAVAESQHYTVALSRNSSAPTPTPVASTAPVSSPIGSVSTINAISSPAPSPSVYYYPASSPEVSPYLSAQIDSIASASYSLPALISGTKLASVASNVSFPEGKLTFYIYKYSSDGIVDASANYYTSTVGNMALVSGSEGKNWKGAINAAGLQNGNYKFFARGSYNGVEYASNYVYFAVNNSTAATPSPTPVSIAPNIIAGIDSSVSGSIISGTKNIWAKSDTPLSGLIFKFYNTASGSFAAYSVNASPSSAMSSGAVSGGFNYWSGVLDSVKLNNGGYKLIAKGSFDGKSVENDGGFYFNVNNLAANTASPSLSPSFSPIPTATFSPYPSYSPAASPDISSSPKISPYVSADAAYLPLECRQKGFTTPESCGNYLQFPPDCRQQNISDAEKCKEYMFKLAMPEMCREKGIISQEECAKVLMLDNFPQECKDANIADEEGCMKFMSSRISLSPECKEADIYDPAACDAYMAEKFMPKECSDAGIKTKEECGYATRTKYGNFARQPIYEKNAPKECVDANISNFQDCEKLIFKNNAPVDCVEAGMLSPEACKKFMFEKYGDKDNIPLDKFPVECRKAGVKTADDCEKIMTKSYLPADCKRNGVDDPEKCDLYLKQKFMPDECARSGAKTQKECDQIMFKKFAPEECKKAGIADEKECKDYMFNLYAPKATCQGLDDWQCKNAIKENHLGSISAKQSAYAKVKSEIAVLSGGDAVKTEDLRKKMGDSGEIIPIKDDEASLKIIKTEENLVLSEDNELIQTAGAAVMVDSDNDGLTDDMEKRIGTDSKNPDSDKDGYKDGDEAKAGYNPLGEGKVAEGKIAPIDEAIMNNQVLSHPKIDGIESSEFSFDKVSNVESVQGSTGGVKYIFAGKAESNSVVTLYVYSDLPIVVTAKTDKYGNWNYEFDKSLMDGEHEAYVVLNDKSGKVVAKSSVMNFFVKEAKAMSVKDFISPALAGDGAAPLKEAERSMNNYVFLTIGIIIAGLAIFIGFIYILKKKKQAPKA